MQQNKSKHFFHFNLFNNLETGVLFCFALIYTHLKDEKYVVPKMQLFAEGQTVN